MLGSSSCHGGQGKRYRQGTWAKKHQQILHRPKLKQLVGQVCHYMRLTWNACLTAVVVLWKNLWLLLRLRGSAVGVPL